MGNKTMVRIYHAHEPCITAVANKEIMHFVRKGPPENPRKIRLASTSVCVDDHTMFAELFKYQVEVM